MNDLALSLRHKGIKWLDQVPSFNLFDTQLTEPDFVGGTLPVSLRVSGAPKGIVHFEIGHDHVTALKILLGLNEPLRVRLTISLHFIPFPVAAAGQPSSAITAKEGRRPSTA